MRCSRGMRIAFGCAAALSVLVTLVATWTSPPLVPSHAVAVAARDEPRAPPAGLVQLFTSVLDVVREVSRSFQRRDDTSATARLLVIVEVLIGALGIASCLTVRGRDKADLVYRIIDVMGALFLAVALLLFGLTMLGRS